MLAVMGLATVGIVVGLVLTLAAANRQRDRALQLQTHSYDVMILARTLSGTIARSEASLGRYVISGDRQLGQLYFDEWRLAQSQIDRLDQLTNDNAEQQPRIDALRRAFQTRGDELSLTALSTNYGKNGQALSRYYQSRKAPALAAINATLDDVIRRERMLLDSRQAEAMETVGQSSRVAGVLALVGLLIVAGAIVLGWLTVRAVAERTVALAEAEAERERAEALAAEVADAADELRIQEAKLRQAQKMDAIGQLTGGIAHDFNNMLAVVLGGLELARRQLGRNKAAALRHIDSATDGANRAAALTRRLLAFSREESLKPEAIGAGALIADMSDLLDRTLGDAVTLIAQDDGSGWRVHADRVQLENAVLNLAVNARDAMHGRGQLTITTSSVTLTAGEIGSCAGGEFVAIAVADTGEGMSPEVAERVFEPFFTTKEAGKGTGLGLSQIFALVSQLGGEVGIATALGEGTTVTLYLPRDRSAPEGATVTAIAPVVPHIPTAFQVLVVEDDPRVLAATVGALEELGYLAIGCPDPLDAPALLAQHPAVDLVVSDVLMPRQTGPELIAELTQHYPHLAVLFVTGFAGEAGAEDLGGHEVLRKPFTLAGLERGIDAAMRRERPDPPAQIAAE